jgi:hypothetical protein
MNLKVGQAIEDDVHKSTSRLILDHAHRENAEESAVWRDLDRKAQGTTAIAGIFLAALSLVVPALNTLPMLLSIVFAVAAFLLGATAIQSVRVLFVREVDSIEDSTEFREAAQDILCAPHNAIAKYKLRSFVIQRAQRWEQVNKGLHEANGEKADKLTLAQRLLISAIAVSLASAILSIFVLANS